MHVPRCLSTQHPDNAKMPFFSDHSVIQGDAEIKEAYYVFSHLGCTEQMWDYEGKEVDAFVVKKLLSRYGEFFREHLLGRELFLTLRVPNPRVEVLEGKVLLETLESIPRSYDTARLFYGDDAPHPIFEVILPMTTSAQEANRVYHYYREFVRGKATQRCFDLSVWEWLGDFRPDRIHVIPLVEDKEHMLRVDQIVEGYLADKEETRQRAFLARSDPALNYGQLSAVLLAKIALHRLEKLQRRIGVEILPILGVGSAPFRGNFRPDRVKETLGEYPSVQTFTIQSAFKYDHREEDVQQAIKHINAIPRGEALSVDEKKCLGIVDKVSARYAECVRVLAPLVNDIASYIPQRRARKLHVGLFGYSRTLKGDGGIHLPRAITFCGALYSVGLPPEILGLSALDERDLASVRRNYLHIDQDMHDCLRYLSRENLRHLPSTIKKDVRAALRWFSYEPDAVHVKMTESILADLQQRRSSSDLTEKIQRAATYRCFLG